MELTNREWKQTELDNLFDIYTGGDLIISRTQKGEIPIISHSMVNNGIAEWTVPIKGQNLFNASNTISLADRGNFYAFTQATDFYIGTRVKALKAKFLNPNKFILLFICTMINKQAVKFSYGNNATGGIGKLKILLPINSEGEFDYPFMEYYTKHKENLLLKQYEKQISNLEPVALLSEKQWKEFLIGDLFRIKIGKNIDGNKIDKQSGKIAYVTRKESNNGFDGFIDYHKTLLNSDFPVITIGNETAEPFVQEFPFFTGTKVNILIPKITLNSKVLFFIASSLRTHKSKYSYSFTINSTRLKRQKIFLPATEQSKPDYLYMENYMKTLEYEKLKRYLEYKQLHTTH